MAAPSATYRLQLDPAHRDLEQVGELVEYFDRLGVSHLYLSPVLAARPGSPHLYDVVDPQRVEPRLGAEDDLGHLATRLAERQMGIVLDVVPNHLAAHHHNRWWMDVLRHGRDSPYAPFFDVRWEAGPVLLPILGAHYVEVLESGDLELSLEEEGLFLRYHEHVLPLAPESLPLVYGERPPRRLRRAAPEELGRLRSRRARRHLERRLEAFRDPDLLHELVERQAYRPVFWQLSQERMSYRRFFDIIHLVGVRVEEPGVFSATHALVGRLLRDGIVEGLRVDHLDGLRRPTAYLRDLRGLSHHPFYLVVEKILAEGEQLPPDWPVEGTTGYEFLNAVVRVFVDPEGWRRLRELYARFVGIEPSFPELCYAQKRRMIRERFGAEFARLGDRLEELARADRHGLDLSPSALREGLAEITACLPVYRTYGGEEGMSQRDREVIEQAVAEAARRHPGITEPVWRFLRKLLTLAHPAPGHLELVLDWQQATGAVTAKGVEDTALYLYNPLIALNEVGGDPGRLPPDAVESFHRHNQRVAVRSPLTMTTVSTHDTKRSADVRIRIALLSHFPDLWGRTLERWGAAHQDRKRTIDGLPAPSANEEIFLYQTLVGVWPSRQDERAGLVDRLEAYLVKAAREAKVHTRWTDPDPDHEEALVAFARALLGDDRFIGELEELLGGLRRPAALLSASQALLHLASPGVPDLYQGSELLDLSLADPDNRRPVDFDLRRALLEDLADHRDRLGLLERLLEEADERLKLFLTWRTLQARRREPELFREGAYLPLPAPRGWLAFARRHRRTWALVTAPVSPEPEEGALPLPEGAPIEWEDLLGGQRVATDREVPLSPSSPYLLRTGEGG